MNGQVQPAHRQATVLEATAPKVEQVFDALDVTVSILPKAKYEVYFHAPQDVMTMSLGSFDFE